MEQDSFTDDEIRKIYSLKNIAVVGMSKNPDKAAHYVPKYLIDNGYNVIPVNPTATEILGRKCYPTLTDIPGTVDVVDVFRPSDQLMPVIEEAIRIKP
ncbi:CoA-binding protein, partial [Candidatus Nitrosotalea sp. FS]|uniref:CoA-binding protein n=1 Tax=Candidatus Nitrosotalea sp. FS TaxID=2341021 RepID=UPI0015A8C068